MYSLLFTLLVTVITALVSGDAPAASHRGNQATVSSTASVSVSDSFCKNGRCTPRTQPGTERIDLDEGQWYACRPRGGQTPPGFLPPGAPVPPPVPGEVLPGQPTGDGDITLGLILTLLAAGAGGVAGHKAASEDPANDDEVQPKTEVK